MLVKQEARKGKRRHYSLCSGALGYYRPRSIRPVWVRWARLRSSKCHCTGGGDDAARYRFLPASGLMRMAQRKRGRMSAPSSSTRLYEARLLLSGAPAFGVRLAGNAANTAPGDTVTRISICLWRSTVVFFVPPFSSPQTSVSSSPIFDVRVDDAEREHRALVVAVAAEHREADRLAALSSPCRTTTSA